MDVDHTQYYFKDLNLQSSFILYVYMPLFLQHIRLQEKDRMRHNEWHQVGILIHIYIYF